MNASSPSDPNPVDRLAEEFVARHRRGERPDLAEYTERFPQYAEAIRDLFPALALIEQVKPGAGEPTGAYTAATPPEGHRLERLGDYRILAEVGRGGMGIVYEAEQESLGRHVALKVLPGHARLDPRQLARFHREARAAAKLHHTNIVPVFGVGEQDGLHYYVMQFIAGQSLDAVLEELRRVRRLRRSQPAATGALPPVENDPGGSGSSAHEVTAAAVAHSLLTGQFALHQPDPRAVGGAPTSDSPSPPSPVASLGGDKHPTASAPDLDPGQAGPAAALPAVSDSASRVPWPGQADRSSLSGSARGYWQGVARVGVQVAEALAYAHGQRILHRDIKPSNLLLDARGNVWVADFGLAKASEGEDLTHTGDVVGTLRYLAPERLRGQSDPRGDVYSLGLTLYELLTLRPAYDATDRERLIQQVTQGEPPRPRQLDSGIPHDLETIVLKAMAREPGHRYETAAALGEDLQRFLEDRPIRARRVSGAERAWRWCRRNPRVAVLSAAVAALLVIVALVSSVMAIRERQAQDDLEENLYFNRISLAAREMEAGNVGRAEELLEECAPWRRGWEWHYLRRIPLDRPMVLPGHTGRIAGIAYSPVGERLASIGLDLEKPSNNGEVKVWDTRLGQEMWTARVNASSVRRGHRVPLAFSQDGQRLAVPDLDRDSDQLCHIKVWDAATGRESLALKGHADLVVGLGFSTHGERIASADSAGFVRLWDATTGRETRAFQSGVRPIFSLAYHPDGRRVALGGEDGTVSLWDAITGQRLLDLRGFDARTYSPVFNRDGTRLAAGGAYGGVKIWDTATGRVLFDLPKLPGSVVGLAFSPDGSRLASSSDDGTIRIWDSRSLKEALSFRTAFNRGIAFSPDGRRLAMALGGGMIRIVSAAPIESATAWGPLLEIRHTGLVRSGGYSPDGTRLNTIESGEGRARPDHVRVRNAADGRILLDVKVNDVRYQAVALSPDGARLAAREDDGSIRLLNAMNGQVLLTFGKVKAHPHNSGLVYSPDGRWIAAGEEGTARRTNVVIWDAKTGQLAHSWDAGVSSGDTGGWAFSPDGRRFAAISDYLRVRVWDVKTGKMLWSALAHSIVAWRAVFSPDGNQIATVGAGQAGLKIWDSTTGRSISSLPGHPGNHWCLAYSPDGRFLASGSSDRAVRIWDLATGQEIRTLVGHTDWITGVIFRPGGRWLASTSRDGTIKVWDVTSLAPGIVNHL
jgi:WD40 repeat protein/serine/threonine protein kinase